MDGQILRRLKQIAKFVVFENLQVSLTVFQSLFYCAFHKHVNSKVQKLPLQLGFSLPSIRITITSNEP